MNKTSIKTRFIVVSSKSLVKWVAKAFTSASQLFIRRLKVILITKDFFPGVNTFWITQNNRPVKISSEYE